MQQEQIAQEVERIRATVERKDEEIRHLRAQLQHEDELDVQQRQHAQLRQQLQVTCRTANISVPFCGVG